MKIPDLEELIEAAAELAKKIIRLIFGGNE
jgi:hypothetical protein